MSEMETVKQQSWDREVDLLVAGAGAGGMSAALVGALEGLDVLICEKADKVGGTTSTSAGTLWVPGNRQSLAAGYADAIDEGRAYLEALIGDERHRDLREAYLETGPDAIDYFMEKTDVQFMACGTHPDYLSHLPGAAVSGRALIPQMFDGRLLGDDFHRIRPPIREFMLFGGMMVGKDDIQRLIGRYASLRNFGHAAALVLRYLRDRLRYRRGTRLVMGNALVARLFYSLRRKGVPILFNARTQSLIQDEGRVIGACVEHGGKILRVRARKGVVLATGGVAHHAALRQAFLLKPTPQRSLAVASNTGDGIELGRAHGAGVEPEMHGGGAFWTPVSVVPHPDGSKGLFPHLSLDRAKPGLIAINSAGRRFVDEGCSYHHFVEAMYKSHEEVSTLPCYLICDRDFIARYGIGVVPPGTRDLGRHIRSGYLIHADSIAGLAGKLKIDAEALTATINRYNELAGKGVDSDFHKGESELSRFNGDPDNKPNPCLRPLGSSGYCAVEIWPADIACSTGLSTDANAAVLDASGKPISGLYACGNDMASIMRGTYPGPGTTLGPALVFGYRAAMHVAHG